MVAMYQQENMIELLRCRLRNPSLSLATEAEVRDLLDSIEAESEKLKEELERLTGEYEPAENAEERKMCLLLWSAKSELFVQAVHLRAERQPLVDSKTIGSRLGTKLKEKTFKAINNRRPTIDKLITKYNLRYLQYRLKFPNRNGFEAGKDDSLTYEKLKTMPLDDAFWNDGFFYHCDAPWAVNPDVREGVNCVLVLSRVQEEFELISQELVHMMAWAIGVHEHIAKQIAYTQERISRLRDTSSEPPEDHLDRIHLTNISRSDKVKLIQKELLNRLAIHNNLVEEWSENVTWLWGCCQPTENQSFVQIWNDLVKQVKQEKLNNFADLNNAEDALEEIVSGEVVDDGEDADGSWVDS
ncbi:uncharacterized protein PGTG_07360 [Puccinia graminis f. sp. tritici CRL 75-36-700-3]|uniref:Uncharacterized protein n=1 Tax=Puccinia graminis f. sp. tritici (strain CRL 75-36-700-3 / race SCCL) TaxID=418459 RepID=E3K9K0_PUCGT|nr:uncharacterized protein PGTG_07360 [Puccinia graminis f. sp. tritici CRL 75-36-700-3]EFP81108.2 hypothetical protein PGTG_07360 [Puccinia graminis f. sp. tritici CRL 75-36-700-3]